MPSRDYFRNLAQMSRRIAGNMTDPAIVAQLQAIGQQFDLEAEHAPASDSTDSLAPLKLRPLGGSEPS
jgi:hypothetical protein